MVAENLAGMQHAGEVGLQNFIPLGFGNFKARGALCPSRRIDQNVNLSKLAHTSVAKLFERLAIGYVGSSSQAAPAALLDFRACTLHLLAPPGGWHHISAGFGQANRECTPDPSSATDHHRNFSG